MSDCEKVLESQCEIYGKLLETIAAEARLPPHREVAIHHEYHIPAQRLRINSWDKVFTHCPFLGVTEDLVCVVDLYTFQASANTNGVEQRIIQV